MTNRELNVVQQIRMAGLLAWLFLMLNNPAVEAAPFQNLGFESAPTYVGTDLNNFPLYAIPNWTVRTGNTVQSGVLSNNYFLDYTTVAIFMESQAPMPVIEGANSVFMSAAWFFEPQNQTASISQVGFVPLTANSLHFNVADTAGFGLDTTLPANFFMTMGGENVFLQVVNNTGGYAELAGDISQWAGQTTELSIGVGVPNIAFLEYWGVVDSVSFSSVSVPEPATLTLGVLAFSGWFLRQRAKSL